MGLWNFMRIDAVCAMSQSGKSDEADCDGHAVRLVGKDFIGCGIQRRSKVIVKQSENLSV